MDTGLRWDEEKKFGNGEAGKEPSLWWGNCGDAVQLHPSLFPFDSAFKEIAISQSLGGRTPSQ